MTGPRLSVRFSATADLYFLLRHLAWPGDSAVAGAWGDVVSDAKHVFNLVSHVPPHAVDAHCAGWSSTDDELAAAALRLPENVAGIPARRFVQTVADLMRRNRHRYEADSLSQRSAAAREAIGSIHRLLHQVESACLHFICQVFGLQPPDEAVRVLVVASGVPLDGFTGLDADDRPLSVVAAETLSGSLLAEAVLHEAVHALSMLAANASETPIARLRGELESRAFGGPGGLGQLWHVPYFVTAAAAVRRYVDRHHVPYGVARGYYQRAGRAAEIAVPVWTEVVQGRLSGTEAVEQMLDSAAI